jgi:hypothetical protein
MTDFPQLLKNAVWHTTSQERFQGILESEYILPDPPIPDKERWGTAAGPTGHPYVRSLGGISLFDFNHFDESQYEKKYPLSNWYAFVPKPHKSDSAVWIRLDSSMLDERFIDGRSLLKRWKSENATRRIMPEIEAAYLGPLSVSLFEDVMAYREGKWSKIFWLKGR